jgi:photosystem II stability/assembly factor-like uncharacterized protein
MKKFYILVSAMFALTIATAQGWQWSNPVPTGNQLNSLFFCDMNTGYAVGSNGTIIKTLNGGESWTEQNSPTDIPLFSVYFTDAITGYAVGYYLPHIQPGKSILTQQGSIILKTTDGGLNWIIIGVGYDYGKNAVCFTDENTGYAVGEYGTIIKTVNGGANWVLENSGTYYELHSVYFTDANTGYAVGNNGTIIKTTDSGSTWTPQSSTTSVDLYSITFATGTKGYAVGNGIILGTSNGGTNWIIQNFWIGEPLFSVDFQDATGTGYAVGGYGKILKTVNGGATWVEQISGNSNSLQSVCITTAGHGITVGNHGSILKTEDGGTNWVDQSISATAKGLKALYFPDPGTGYIVGDSGTIVKTTDEGTNWVLLNSGTDVPLNSCSFPDVNTGYAAGAHGTILKTTDAGAIWWLFPNSSINASLNSVFFTDINTGYVVGDSGVVLKTIDGGANWTPLNAGNYNFTSVHFPAPDTGFITGTGDLGSSVIILKTIDGGLNWVQQYSCFNYYLTLSSIHFPDVNTGYVVGYRISHRPPCTWPYILKTIDGGTTWEDTLSIYSSGLTLSSVCFFDANTGYVTGSGGTILKTTDGGINWLFQNSRTSKSLSSVFFTGENTGYAVGEYGTILKTTDGGGFPVGSSNLAFNCGKLKIYPNPSTARITIETSVRVSSGRLSVLDLNGQEIITCQVYGSRKQLDISTFPRGIYFVKITNDKTVETGKIVKY